MPGGFGAKVVESPQRRMYNLSLKKSGLGTPALSGSCAAWCTVTDNGVGDYTINFTKIPWDQVPECFVQIKTTNAYAQLGTVSALAVQILTKNIDDDSALEADFDLLVLGCLARDLIAP